MITKFLNWFNTDEPTRIVKETASNIADEAAYVKKSYQDYLLQIESYKQRLNELELQRQKETRLFLAIIDHIEDMIWAKDMEGRYIIANKTFRDNFCYGVSWSEIRGKTDSEIVRVFKDTVGDANHTLMENSASDSVIHQTEEAKHYLEQGLVNGKLVKLVVSKSPVYDFEGTMFATCGTGRDITQLQNDLERVINAGNPCLGSDGKKLLLKELKKLNIRQEEDICQGKVES